MKIKTIKKKRLSKSNRIYKSGYAEGSRTGFIAGWNACLEAMPKKMEIT